MSDLKKIKEEFLLKLNKKLDVSEINEIKSNLFGKNGLISSQFKRIGSIAESEKKKFASDLNFIKDELQNIINSKINEAENTEINKKLEKEKVDITLPERSFVITNDLSGKVISTFSFSNFLFISVFSASFIFELIIFCSSSLIKFKSEANFFFSLSAIDPILLNCEEINPFFPNRFDLISFISDTSNFLLSFKRNSSFIFLRSDIFTDYFFSKIKQ